MSEPFIGQIQAFGFNFAPMGWAPCDGRVMNIAQNSALYALLGVTYGGNGTTTFNLPDLRGRVAISQGQGPGLTTYGIGTQVGSETVAITQNQMPAHAHAAMASTSAATEACPTGAVLAAPQDSQAAPGTGYIKAAPNVTMAPAAIGNTGQGQGHENRQPTLVVNFCIALQGIFPTRD
jgi:microcystin-dependent protein